MSYARVAQYLLNETVFSKLTNLFSKKIHAVKPRGFELKIVFSCWLLYPVPVGGNLG